MNMEYIWILLIIMFASFIQGMTSFGSSLIALPLLLLFMDVKEVVPFMALLNLAMNGYIYREVGKDANLKKISPLIITALIFTVVGGMLLKNLPEQPIRLIVGGIMLVTAVSKLFGVSVQFKKPEKLFIPVGVLSGILNGATGMSGPPVLLFLSNLDVTKKVFRSTLTTYFLFLNMMAITMFTINKILYGEIFLMAVIYTVPMLFATHLGILTSRKIHDERFKKIVLFIMVVMALNLISKAI